MRSTETYGRETKFTDYAKVFEKDPLSNSDSSFGASAAAGFVTNLLQLAREMDGNLTNYFAD